MTTAISDQTKSTSSSDNIQALIDERIRRTEEEFDLLQYKIDGWCAWSLFRFWVASQMISGVKLERKFYPATTVRQLLFAIKSIPNFLFPKKAKYLIKSYTSARSEMQGVLFKDVYFDELLMSLGNYLKVESINNPGMLNHSVSALIPSDIYASIISLIVFVLEKINRASRKYALFEDELGRILKTELELTIPQGAISKNLAYFYWAKRVYGWLLDRIKPQYVLTADPGEFQIIAAAKERGIQTIEFYHGVVDHYYWPYTWSSYAIPYKDLLPIADKIFIYSGYAKEELDTRGFWKETLRVVGSLRVDEYRHRKIPKYSNEVCTITITTQGIQRIEFIHFISEFLRRSVEESLTLKLFIKLHPVHEQDGQPYRDAFKKFGSAVTIVPANQPPSTFELITQSHMHASISSACHYEALGLGVPTIILPFATHESVLKLYTAGHAFLAGTPEELLSIAQNWRKHTVQPGVSQYYFEPNALKNMIYELN